MASGGKLHVVWTDARVQGPVVAAEAAAMDVTVWASASSIPPLEAAGIHTADGTHTGALVREEVEGRQAEAGH